MSAVLTKTMVSGHAGISSQYRSLSRPACNRAPHGRASCPLRPNVRPSLHRPASTGEGSFYESEIVAKESVVLFKDIDNLSGLMEKYPFFDVAGKKLFLEHMQSVCDRLKIFHARATLSGDSAVKKNLNDLDRQLLFLSTNAGAIYEGQLLFSLSPKNQTC